MLNAKIQAAEDVRLFIIDLPAAEAATKIGDEISLAVVHGIC
jgi:hypothetical protein